MSVWHPDAARGRSDQKYVHFKGESMKQHSRNAWLLSVFLVLAGVFQSAAADKVYMASLEWPPYSGSALPDQGAAIAVAKAALEAMGHELVVEFYPWSRAVKLVQQPNSKYVAYLPEYKYETEDFQFSEPLGEGPLGLVENVSKPITWEQVEDLERYRIGVVQDYVNTKAFDDLVAAGRIKVEAVGTDTQNILKVAAGRLNAAVIDSNVMAYLLANTPRLKSVSSKVRMNDRLLEMKDIYAAFANNAAGAKWREILDEGLTKIDVGAILDKHIGASK